MKIYNGWVLLIAGQEYTVDGSVKIRGTQSYMLRGQDTVKSIRRSTLLQAMARSRHLNGIHTDHRSG